MSKRFNMNSKYYFFYGGPFSQWYMSSFIIDHIIYYTAEQYMMAQKALMFGDMVNYNNIINTKSPKLAKEFGRKVQNFNAKKWTNVCKDIVYEGNYAKFNQNVLIKSQLLDTAPKILVEASPYDKIWGIGLSADDIRVNDQKQWLGTNWLGEILTKLRNDFLK